MEKSIYRANHEDLREILQLQYLSYQSEADLFGSRDIPPLKQTLDEVINEYNVGIILKMIDENGNIIGSVRAKEDKGTVYIGKLMVHPQHRHNGYGTTLLAEIEQYFPEKRYELFTSTRSKDNIQFYQRMGYKIFKHETINDELQFLYFEKYKREVAERLLLVRPSKQYAEQVMLYKEEMIQNGDSFDGCAGLEDVQSFEEWIDFETRLKAKYKDGYVPSEVFLAIREKDNYVVGIIDFRHPLSDFLLHFGGNIGYSVRPSERQKGYASEMLRLILSICCDFGENKVLLTCDKENIDSMRTIIKNGGVLENEVVDTVGLSQSGIIQRYWIST